MVSIKDVAKRAGVATSTVSKVLNNYPNISENTKRKVNDAIKELNFVPNAVASALSSKQSGRVAILMNQSVQTTAIDEIYMQYLLGAIVKSKELGLDVITIFFSMLEDISIDEIIVYLRSQNITGLIVFGLSKSDTNLIELVRREEFKCVLIDAPLVNKNTSCVWINQAKAQYDVVSEVLNKDEVKSILYISGKENGFVTSRRLEGIETLCRRMGLKLTIKQGDFSEKKAREITMKYGKNHDMIACASDLMAIGAMKALTEMDIFRPVSGFDGIALMGYVGKQMFTVKQDFRNIADRAVEEMDKLLHGAEGSEVITTHEIVRLQYLDIIC
ncbi:MAG: LacI family transcriptional regulator [Lachnospiraceae bacterium]|nr:LacI family transcriptional regulator [Lachnospiraceae bacterium]